MSAVNRSLIMRGVAKKRHCTFPIECDLEDPAPNPSRLGAGSFC